MAVAGCPDCASLNPITDPLVAAVLHNRRHIPIGRLPEKLILCILDYLTDDMQAGFCLGKVSRQFRRLVSRLIPGKHTLGWNNANEMELGGMQAEYGLLKISHPKVYAEILSGTRRDRFCNTCLALSVPVNTASMVIPALRKQSCKFNLWGKPEVRCDGCECCHPRRTFSEMGLLRHICIGREGFVRVCQHKNLSWSQIETNMAQILADADGLVRIREYCEDPSHRNCPGSTPPHFEFEYVGRTGQKEIKRASIPIYLHVLWESHNQVSEANLDGRGRLRAPFLRALFRDTAILRQPPTGTESHMGMTCFSNSQCRCVYYEPGSSGVPAVEEAVEDTNATGFRACLGRNPGLHETPDAFNNRLCAERMAVRLCTGTPFATKDPCIVTKYYRRILIHRLERGAEAAPTNPTHEWLHALDTENLGSVLGCRNPDCGDYFRSFQVIQCPEPPKNIKEEIVSNLSAFPNLG